MFVNSAFAAFPPNGRFTRVPNVDALCSAEDISDAFSSHMELGNGDFVTGINLSEELIPQRPKEVSAIASLSCSGLLNPPLQLQTNQAECGGQLWPAGMVLAEYILRERLDFVRGKRIIELGAGSGLVGLAIALGLCQRPVDGAQSQTHIRVTDGLPALIPLLKTNIDLNRAQTPEYAVSLTAELLQWGQKTEVDSQQPDIVLAADCAYLEESFPLLVNTLNDLMGERTVLWFCYKKRRKRDKDCIKLIRKSFNVRAVHGHWELEGVFLFEVNVRSTS